MKKKSLSIIPAVFAVLLFAHTLSAQSTAFSYQGSLQNGATPASGNHDFEFALFDSLAGGSQIGSPVGVDNVVVVNGIFSVKIDFGAAFPGAGRFLEIRVKPAGQPGFTTLTPRQPIDSSPYAIKSLNADMAATATNATQLGGVAANQFVVTTDSRMTNARNPLPGSVNYIWNQNEVLQPSSNFVISGNGDAGGTLSANAINSTTQYNIGFTRVLSVPGTDNIFAGVGAGSANTTGSQNSFFGRDAGLLNTQGTDNSFFGRGAGGLNSLGSSNSFFGRDAGLLNTFGSSNSFFGRSAGRGNVGADNSFFGRDAGIASSGSGNSFFGRSTGEANSADDNSFFGASAGRANSNGTHNSFFGANAGDTNTSGSENSFFGHFAGRFNTTASDNSFFGSSAGRFNTGNGNSFFGHSAGEGNTTGNENSFFGHSAGYHTRTGVGNSSFGSGAGFGSANSFIPPGNSNSIFGRDAGRNNVGDDNSFFGESAGESNTGGESNSFFGRFAGTSNQSADNNSFFGHSAGFGNTSGGSNSFFGRSAGQSNTGGNFNSFFGRFAGISNLTGNFNTIIGDSADVLLDNLSFATAIGAGAVVANSNTVVLGRGDDIVRIPGFLRVVQLGSPGSVSLCQNVNFTISTCSSSIRYKSNVNSFRSGLSLIQRLRPVSFNWKEGGTLDMGLVAEEVAEVEPLLITTNKQGEIEGVKYDRIGVVLVNAIKEQQAQISELDKTIDVQLRSIDALRRQIEALKQLVCATNATADACKEN